MTPGARSDESESGGFPRWLGWADAPDLARAGIFPGAIVARPWKLTDRQLDAALRRLNGWSHEAGRLRKAVKFRDFGEAFGFRVQVALAADRMNHHPDSCNSYNRVTVDLMTHQAGGITARDIELAHRIEQILARPPRGLA